MIGAINDAAGETGVVVCAAGSAPGDLHKLWRARDPAGKGYHVEYGYSCMGYEIPGGIGVKLAAPEREVIVLVGDGSYLMAPGELVTAVAERIAITIVLVDNHGYASIGALSRSVGGGRLRHPLPVRAPTASLPLDDAGGARWPDRAAGRSGRQCREPRRARDPGARRSTSCATRWPQARGADGPVVVYIETDRYAGVPSYDGWWDVPVAEVSEQRRVRGARREYERAHGAQRTHLERSSPMSDLHRLTPPRPRRRRHDPGRHARVGGLELRRLRGGGADARASSPSATRATARCAWSSISGHGGDRLPSR